MGEIAQHDVLSSTLHTATPSQTWYVPQRALLRSTGFPFEAMEALQDQEFFSSLQYAIQQDEKQVDWGTLQEQFQRAIDTNLQRLIDICRTPRFLEAVFLSSPDAYTRIQKWLATTPHLSLATCKYNDRRMLQKLMLYLQRFCTKNESMSFFGPTFWATFQPEAENLTKIDFNGEQLVRKVYWSHWAANRLARCMQEDPETWEALIPYRPPWLFINEAGTEYRKVHFIDHPTIVEDLEVASLTDQERKLLARCDGTNTLQTIALLMGVEDAQGIDALGRQLEALERRQLVIFHSVIPVGLAHPLRALRTIAQRLSQPAGDRWTTIIDDLEAQRQKFEQATLLEERVTTLKEINTHFSAITGSESQRGGGEVSADRAVLFEDCYRDMERFEVGGELHRALHEDIPDALPLLFQLPLARLRMRKKTAHAWFVERFGRGCEVSLAVALQATQDGELERRLIAADGEVIAHGPSLICDLLYKHADQARVHLDRQWVKREAAAIDFDAWALCSADIHVGARSIEAACAGDFQLVLGEVHALNDLMLVSSWPLFLERPEEHVREILMYNAKLSPARVCEPTLLHWHKQMTRVSRQTPVIDFVGCSSVCEEQKSYAYELTVRDDGDCLQLIAPRFGAVELTRPPLFRWYDEPRSLFGAFAGLRLANMIDLLREPREVRHLPRLQIENLTLLRESWWLEPLKHMKWRGLDFSCMREVWKQKESYGLPDVIYAKFEEEDKPLFVDFHNPFLVDLFARHWSLTDHEVRVTEMVPTAQELWLQDQQGRYTNEFRIAYYRPQEKGVTHEC